MTRKMLLMIQSYLEQKKSEGDRGISEGPHWTAIGQQAGR